jgi:hypothetical protein
MEFVTVYLGYAALGLASAFGAVRLMRKYVSAEDLRWIAGITFFLWPCIVVFVVAMLIWDEFGPDPRA